MNGNSGSFDFVKMSGAGNDFILIDQRKVIEKRNWSAIAPQLCDRHNGIGADGMLIVEPSSSTDFRMLYFNADGSYGGMCGNGGRCIALYVMDLEGKDSVEFDALGYRYSACRTSLGIRLSMKDTVDFRSNVFVEIDEQKFPCSFIDTGSPHVVIFVNELPANLSRKIQEEGIIEIGRAFRKHPIFAPSGTNVNFVTVVGGNKVSMRTYERGVEAETLACGTGAVASAIIAARMKGINPPIEVHTRSGESLFVSFELIRDNAHNVSLEGSARRVFSGKMEMFLDHLQEIAYGTGR